eukprot:689733-Amphidinium_carterae.2
MTYTVLTGIRSSSKKFRGFLLIVSEKEQPTTIPPPIRILSEAGFWQCQEPNMIGGVLGVVFVLELSCQVLCHCQPVSKSY